MTRPWATDDRNALMMRLYKSGVDIHVIRAEVMALPGGHVPAAQAVKHYITNDLSVRRDEPKTRPAGADELVRDIPHDAVRTTFRMALAWGRARKVVWDTRREWPDRVVQRINAVRVADGERVFDVVRVG